MQSSLAFKCKLQTKKLFRSSSINNPINILLGYFKYIKKILLLYIKFIIINKNCIMVIYHNSYNVLGNIKNMVIKFVFNQYNFVIKNYLKNKKYTVLLVYPINGILDKIRLPKNLYLSHFSLKIEK